MYFSQNPPPADEFCTKFRKKARTEGNVLFTDSLNTVYLRLNGIVIMEKDRSDSKRGNPLLPPHRLLFPISSEGSSICTIPQTGWPLFLVIGICKTSDKTN